LNVLSAALLVGCIAGIVFTEGFGELLFAAVIGAVVTMHAVVWTLGGHVDQLPLMRGIWGEEFTEDALDELERLDDGWSVEHDIPSGKGNWDHVVVARAGVFAIETKWISGSAVVEANALRLGKVPYPAKWFSGAAADLHDAVAASGENMPWVRAVVVIWGQFDQGVVELAHVTFVRGAGLVEWLRSRPTRLSQERADKIAAALHEFATAATAAEQVR
jgi:hypothetical protein